MISVGSSSSPRGGSHLTMYGRLSEIIFNWCSLNIAVTLYLNASPPVPAKSPSQFMCYLECLIWYLQEQP